MAEFNRDRWHRGMIALLDQIAPKEGAILDSVCVFYCRETNNFGIYNTSQDTITDIVEIFNCEHDEGCDCDTHF
jgi:hypothetical protein